MTLAAPWHAHIYFTDRESSAAEALHRCFAGDAAILFTGTMTDGPAGPHPVPQFEVHFREDALDHVRAVIRASGLVALMHPLTLDDLADHTSLGQWIGDPITLDLTVLDPPGVNQGIARFGLADF